MKEINLFKSATADAGQRPFLMFGHRSISYAGFNDYIGSTVKQLKKFGVAKGSRVAIVSPNSAEQVIVLFALWKLEAVACLVSERFPAPTIQKLLKKFNCSVFLCSAFFPDIYSSGHISLRKFHLEDMINHDVRHYSGEEGEHLSLEQEATIILTSGTGSDPKAVLHTLGNHYFNALGANEHIPVGPGDRWLLNLPLYHVGGSGIIFRVALAGATLVIAPNDQDLASSIKKYNITHVSMVATQLFRLLQSPVNQLNFPSLKAVLVGGGPIPHNLIQKAVRSGLPIHTTYGLTEMASQVATSDVQAPDAATAQGLKILNSCEVKISGQGEILVKGKTLFKGYVEGNKITLPLTNDGWFETGDLGSIDKNGWLEVLGRKDNMFVSGGENIHPEEIEKHLSRMEHIREAIVVAVKDQEYGYRPVAVLKADPGLNIDEVISNLEKIIPRFKIPEQFYAWPESLEENGLKTSRRKLAQLLQSDQDQFKKIG